MVVLLVGIPGVEAGTLPGTSDKLEFVSVETLADAVVFLENRTCDAVLIGREAADVNRERLASLSRRQSLAPEANRGSASSLAGSGDEVENTFRNGSIREMERLMILDRLAQLNQNRTRSAESLEISVRTLRNKLRDYRTELVTAGSDSKSG
jgi:DNA-binding NtrC family response regulator